METRAVTVQLQAADWQLVEREAQAQGVESGEYLGALLAVVVAGYRSMPAMAVPIKQAIRQQLAERGAV